MQADRLIKNTLFYLAGRSLIVLFAVFPFYYAIITSFKSGTAIFQVDYLPTSSLVELHRRVQTQGNFAAQPPELV